MDSIENVNKTYTDPITGKFVAGNPGGGRPKDSISITTAVKRKLQELSPDQKRTYIDALADQIVDDAIKGQKQDRRMTWNYVDGMPQQKVELSGDLNIQIVKFNDENITPTV